MTGVASISVSVPCRRWLARLPGARALCRKTAAAAFEIGADSALPGALTGALTGRGSFEVSLVLGDDDFVRALNCTYRGRDAATNVLAFGNFTAPEAVNPASSRRRSAAMTSTAMTSTAMTGDGEKPVLLGDVVIAYETAVAEALAQRKSIEAHLCHLVVHGVLHLLGYDHEDETDALRMERIEATVLGQLGLPDPYRLESAASD
ncbi:MAG: rRNA maturation RNase YbeY [Proteobacteria bacterium]|nr:rRNA maturation RNase YbeY [Pseudomonadota bacterium]